MQQMIFIADLIACSTCFGHHYAHHQELENIIQVVGTCRICCFGFQVVGMVWSWGLCVWFAGCNHLYNTLELLMMGIVVPETCWARNKICNKNHLLHQVGFLFPHIKITEFKDTISVCTNYIFINNVHYSHPYTLADTHHSHHQTPRKK